MSEKWRILYAVQNVGVDLEAVSGPAVLIRQTVEGLRQAGHQATVMGFQGRSVWATDSPNTPIGERTGVPLGITGTRLFKGIESGLRRLQSELKLPYFGFFESLRFYEAARHMLPKYDLCHEYHTLFGLGAALACRRLNIPRIMTVDADLLLESALVGRPLRGFQAAVARWAVRLSFQTADKLICVSEAARSHFVTKWGIAAEKIAVVANGVDPAKFDSVQSPAQARAELGLDGRAVIIFVGGFQPWHGLDLLVEAFASVVERRPDACLVLVGDGPARPEIQMKIDSMNLNQSVLITGYVDHETVPRWLAAADIAVAPYPNLPEALWFSPLKLYEYMAAGKAIVASQAGQIAEVIQDGHNGLLIESGETSKLSQAIINLLDDPEGRKRLGENARQQARNQHSWATYTSKLETLYQSL